MTLFGVDFTNVQDAVFAILGTMIDWLYILVVAAIIYLLFELVTGGEGIKNLFGKKDGGDDHESDRDKRRKKKKEEEEEEEEEKSGKPKKNPKGLDNEHPGRIRILVTNADDNPVPDAKVLVRALDMPLWRRALRRHNAQMTVYEDRTGPDGLCPSRVEGKLIGSGAVRIIVKSRMGDADTEAIVVPSEEKAVQVIQVTLSRRGEREEAYEPHIMKVEENEPAGSIVMTGVVR